VPDQGAGVTLCAIARLRDDTYRALCAEIADSFQDPERSSLLSSIAPKAGA
jgi:hypothetical protein